MIRKICPGLLAAGLCLLYTPAGVIAGAGQPPPARAFHVSVVQKDGTPVTDMTAADFEVKEGGRPCVVAGAELSKTPLRLALIVADAGTGGFQHALAALVQKLQDGAEFSLVSVIKQPDRLVDFTTDLDKVVEGLKKLGPRGTTKEGGQVMEAVAQAAREAPQGDKRPVIVVMTVGIAASTDLPSDTVRDALRRSGTVLYALSPQGSGGQGGGGVRYLDVVLNDGSKETGGRHEQFSNQTLVKIVEQIAGELLNQYRVSCTLPEGAKPSDRLEVTTKRKGVRVNAPSRIAN